MAGNETPISPRGRVGRLVILGQRARPDQAHALLQGFVKARVLSHPVWLIETYFRGKPFVVGFAQVVEPDAANPNGWRPASLGFNDGPLVEHELRSWPIAKPPKEPQRPKAIDPNPNKWFEKDG